MSASGGCCWRLRLAPEVGALGRGWVTRVARAAAVSHATVHKAIAEAGHPAETTERVRRRGGGRKCLREQDPGLSAALAWIIHGEIERAARRSQRSCPGCPVARCKRTWVSS